MWVKFNTCTCNIQLHVHACTQSDKVLWQDFFSHIENIEPRYNLRALESLRAERFPALYSQKGHSHLQELAGYKSWFLHHDRNLEIFYKCGHKNLTIYRDQHHAANCKKSCDYLGISAIICIAADVWTLEQIILVFFARQGQGLYSGLISGMRSSVNRIIIPLGD